MTVTISSPPGYSDGAFKATIELNAEERELLSNYPGLTFPIPVLPKRVVYSDDGFKRAVPSNNETTLRGQIVDGCWEGHVYTNGVSEAQNPTPIDQVQEALASVVGEMLETARAWGA